jgi:tetratricopeptide (TPR) repeat protein
MKRSPIAMLLLAVSFSASAGANSTASIQRTFERASQALQAEDYAAAEAGFREVLRVEPSNLGALGNLGVVYSRTHRYANAIEVYKRALRISPKYPGILLNLGLAYFKQDNYAMARPYFAQLHALRLEDAQATKLLATCLVFGGKPAAALDLLKPLAAKDPDPANLYLLSIAYSKTGQGEAGKQVFGKLLTDPSTRMQADFVLGRAYYDSDLFQEAEGVFKDVVAADAAFPGVHRELGKVYISLRRNDQAQEELRLALQQDPKDESAGYFLGALLVQIGLYFEGVPYLERGYALNPDSWAACFYLGKAKLKLNDPQGAVNYLQKAADLNPDEATVFYLLGTALRSAGRAQDSRKAFQRVTELHTTKLDANKRALEDAHVVGAH